MPPKKKSVTTKAQKPGILNKGLLEPETHSLPVQLNKIPKGPIFRKNVDDGVNRSIHQQIRVKLWKLHSCKLKYFEFKNPTTKKSFRSLKKLKIDPASFSEQTLSHQFNPTLRFCQSLKLDSLSIVCKYRLKSKIWRMLKAFRNSRLRNCSLVNEAGWYYLSARDIDPRWVATFRRFKKCNLSLCLTDEERLLLLNTDKLSWKKLLQCKPAKINFRQENTGNLVLKNTPGSIEGLRYETNPGNSYESLSFPLLSNLQKLSLILLLNPFIWSRPTHDLSFIKQFSKLESLNIQIDGHQVTSLDFLADLPSLKEFYFTHKQFNTQERPLINLPNLTKLEIIRFHLEGRPVLAIDDVRNFILNNQNLKSLDLSLPIGNIGTICEGDNFYFPNLEKLSIHLDSVQKPYTEEAENIAQALKRHHFIHKLQLTAEKSNADLIEILLQGGLVHMKSLQDLTLKFKKAGGLKAEKFQSLKNIFENLVNLTSLELDISRDLVRPPVIISFLDDLSQLKNLNLKKLWLSARLNITRGNLNHLSSFLVSVRHLRDLQIQIKGVSKKEGTELEKNLLIQSALTEGLFSFEPDL